MVGVEVVTMMALLVSSQPDTVRTGVGEFAGPPAEMFDNDLEGREDTELLERLAWLHEHPLDINRASIPELLTIPGISAEEADSIAALRKELHHFSSWHQLDFPGTDGMPLAEKLQPYGIIITPGHSLPFPRIALTSRLTKDLQPRRGFLDGSYSGSPIKNYARVFLEPGQGLSGGGLFEKDAGEASRYGFVSGFLAIHDAGPVENAVIGDFVVEAGQGLVFWRGTTVAKGGGAVNGIQRTGSGARPYHSTDESRFFRGAAFTITTGRRTRLLAFYSGRALSAGTDDAGAVTSLDASGLFRTTGEVSKRGALFERTIGGSFRTEIRGIGIGVQFCHSLFDRPFVAETPLDFAGPRAVVAGFDVSATVRQVSLFGEIAASGSHTVAGVAGAILRVPRTVDVAILHRRYPPAFTSVHGSAFGERGQNEQGTYFGVRVPVAAGLVLSGYADQFSFPWRTPTNPFPSSGTDLAADAEFRVNRSTVVSMRYRRKRTTTSETRLDQFLREDHQQVGNDHQRVRAGLSWQLSHAFRFRERIEVNAVGQSGGPTDRGVLVYHDLHILPAEGLSVDARMVFFGTDSYDARMYEFENDLPGVYANPPLSGRGVRWYLLVSYRTSWCTLSSRYAETRMEDVRTLGSGDAEIEGNRDNRVSLAVELRL